VCERRVGRGVTRAEKKRDRYPLQTFIRRNNFRGVNVVKGKEELPEGKKNACSVLGKLSHRKKPVINRK